MAAAAQILTTARTAALAAAAALTCALAGCSASGGGADPAAAASASQVMRAQAAATQEFGLLSGGGWAQAWGLWAVASQHIVGQAAYVQINKACPAALGIPYVIENTAPDGADTMQVTWQHGTTTGTNIVILENGSWRFVPDTTEVKRDELGPAKAVAQLKAVGRCH
ncbi:hypothetical protein [Actinospica robiniae]|uniref:hypothetical protein n=1 Tax=Actinospica robiniae TaxID=304901 RepID=UPI00041A46BF|nr:hypothetical protein [Actinospica robiniae]